LASYRSPLFFAPVIVTLVKVGFWNVFCGCPPT